MLGRERTEELRSAVFRMGRPDPPEDYDREDDQMALREAHWPIKDAAWRRSDATDLLKSCLNDPLQAVRRGAAIALGNIAPGILLSAVAERLASTRISKIGRGKGVKFADYEEGLKEAAWALGDYYFGDHGCPGHLNTLAEDSAERGAEYQKLHRLCTPVIAAFLGTQCGVDLATLLDSVRPASVA